MVDKTRLRRLGGGHQDKARIIVMAVLFVVVLGAFIYLQIGQDGTPKDYWEVAQKPAERIPSVRRIPGAEIDPDILASVRDGRIEARVQRDPEAYTHLLSEVHKLVPGDMEALGIVNADYQALQADPAAWRGHPLRVKGTLDSIWSHGDDEQSEYRGLLHDADGHSYFFTVVERPEVMEGDVVKLEGFFFKLFAYQDESQKTLDNLPYVLGKSMVRSFLSWPPVTSLDPNLLANVKDESLSEMDTIENEALWHLISYARNVDPGTFSGETIEVRHRDMMDRAQELRGVPVRITGTFQLKWEALLGPGGENPLDLPRVWHGLLWQGGRRLIYLVDPEPFPAWAKEGDHVWIYGLFFKRHAWESKREGVVSGPLVVVERIAPWERPSQVWSPALIWGAAGLAGLVLAGFLVSIFADRRAARVFRQIYIDRQRRRLEEAGLATRRDSGQERSTSGVRADHERPESTAGTDGPAAGSEGILP